MVNTSCVTGKWRFIHKKTSASGLSQTCWGNNGISRTEFTFTFSLVAAHHSKKRGKKVQWSLLNCGHLYEKLIVSADKNSQLTEDDGNKKRSVGQSRQLTYDWRIKKRARGMKWVICKSLFNHLLCQRQFIWELCHWHTSCIYLCSTSAPPICCVSLAVVVHTCSTCCRQHCCLST